MSHARMVLPGTVLAVIHRCSEQRWFLKPSPSLNRLIAFLLAHYATKHGIELHGFTFMSNHLHLVLTDRRGCLPKFMGEFDSMLSRVVNRRLGRRGRLWEGAYRSLPLETQVEVLGHLAYVAANPVEAGVVSTPDLWPGLISLPQQVGTSRVCTLSRAGLFGCGREGSALPAQATLSLSVPPFFDSEPKVFRRLFRRALAETLIEIKTRVRDFKGAGSVKFLDPFSSPAQDLRPTFQLQPHLTNACVTRRAELKIWRAAYRAAFARWQEDKTTIFPAGAYLVVVRHKAKAAPPPD